jgi:hypothetical protein
MFYKVQVLDAKGKLKKLLTSRMLSKRHWDLFPDNIKKSEKEKNLKQKKINLFRLKQNIIDLLGVEITGKK